MSVPRTKVVARVHAQTEHDGPCCDDQVPERMRACEMHARCMRGHMCVCGDRAKGGYLWRSLSFGLTFTRYLVKKYDILVL